MEQWTSLKLIEWTADFFAKKDVPNPRLDAEHLLAATLGCQRIDLYAQYNRPVQAKELAQYRSYVERRARREPLQYIMGDTEFYGLPIRLNADVLIPRPETELLVEEALKTSPPAPLLGKERVAAERRSGEVLDIGTGSGCIAIALAKNVPDVKIIATDTSLPALALARENAQLNGVGEQIEFVETDLFPGQDAAGGVLTFPLIVSNPPYIRSDELATLQIEVYEWEPKQALDGGADGLAVYRQIVSGLSDRLAAGGHFVGEIGSDQGSTIQALFSAQDWCEAVEVKADLAGQDRIVIARRKAMG